LERIDYQAVFSLADTGDPLAVALRNRAIGCWAWLIDEMARLYDPEVTVIGGGIMASADAILPRLRAELGGRLRLEAAALGDAAALAGCGEIAGRHPL
jgi:glucokinase